MKCSVCGRGWSRATKLGIGAFGCLLGGFVLWMLAGFFTGSVGLAAAGLLAGIAGFICCIGEASND